MVLITGASSGLGEALAHTFFLAGCKVVLAARRKDELERVRKDLLELHTVNIDVLLFNCKYPANALQLDKRAIRFSVFVSQFILSIHKNFLFTILKFCQGL